MGQTELVSSNQHPTRLQTRRSSLRSLAAAAGGLAVGMLAAPREAQARMSLGDLQAQIDALTMQVADLSQRTNVVESNIMWSGGPATHGTLAGWNIFTTEVTEFDTATDYLDVSPGGLITFLKTGFYRVNFHTITYAHSNSVVHLMIDINGSNVHGGFLHRMGGQWTDLSADLVCPCSAGDQLSIRISNSLGSLYDYAYHSWSSGNHTRLQVSFVGT